MRRTRSDLRTWLGAVCWLLTGEYFAIQPIVAAAWPQPYSYLHNYVSDLGNTACGPFAYSDTTVVYVCSPLHPLTNASLVILGLLTVAGAVLTWRTWPQRMLTSWSLALVAISGVCVVVIGLAPENVAPDVHSLAALAQIPVQFAGMVGLAIVVWRRWRAAAIWSLVCGGFAALGTVLFFSGQYLGLGIGGAERLSLDPFTVWTVGLGAGLLWVRARPPADRAPESRRFEALDNPSGSDTRA